MKDRLRGLGMVVHAHNLSTRRLKQEVCHMFHARLSYIMRPCCKKKNEKKVEIKVEKRYNPHRTPMHPSSLLIGEAELSFLWPRAWG